MLLFEITVNYIRLLDKCNLHCLQMIHHTDKLIGTIQCELQDNLPICLINPTILQGILRNVSLQLPEG